MPEFSADNDVTLAIIGGVEPGDDLVIDCLLSDNHNFESEVTEFPVESGGTISDNIRNKPLVVTMDCLISNTPIGQVARFRDQGTIPADTAYASMLKIRNARRPVTIRTSLSTYKNMALQSLSIPRESGRGDELRFTATFKQIDTVVNKRDTRVAIVGLQSGGSQTFTLVRDDSISTAYIYVPDSTWYDPQIGGWRQKVFFARPDSVTSTNNITNIKGGAPGVADLYPFTPIDIPENIYDNETVAEHTTALVRARVKKAQGGQFRTVFYKKNPRDILVLNKNQFRIVRLG